MGGGGCVGWGGARGGAGRRVCRVGWARRGAGQRVCEAVRGEEWGGLVRLLATVGPLVRRPSPLCVPPSVRPVLRRAVPVRPTFTAAGRGGTRPPGSAAATGTPLMRGDGALFARAGSIRRPSGPGASGTVPSSRAGSMLTPSLTPNRSLCPLHARGVDRLGTSRRKDLVHVSRARGHAVSWRPVLLRPLPRGDRAHRLRLPWGLPSPRPPPSPHVPPRRGPRRFRPPFPPFPPSRQPLPPPPTRARRRDRDLRRGDRDSDCQWGVAGSGSWQRQHRRRPTRPPGTPPAETVHG